MGLPPLALLLGKGESLWGWLTPLHLPLSASLPCLPPRPSSCPPPPSSLLLPSLSFWSPHLGFTCPGLSFFLVLPSWLCVQDPSPWSRSLTAILSPSLLAWQLGTHYSRGPDSSSGPLLSFSSASTPWSPARRNPPPFGELSAQAPPLTLPLPCSPLIEMLMRLLLLPSLAGRRAPWPASAPVR